MKDLLEKHISRAEISYKSGKTTVAIKHAQKALKTCTCPDKTVALKIFIARAYSKIGKYSESNQIYRELLRNYAYMPPIIAGLFYNNFKNCSPEKMRLNINLIKITLGDK